MSFEICSPSLGALILKGLAFYSKVFFTSFFIDLKRFF
ncbi:hypothetical protein Gotri_019056 [Gossypium trilobum]|uniref:Uncharacterized protein n=1 Tax=Gossypium trilobum TaxID=34281 RepID=A0A7J9EBK7_9ROSI|nr:hypothetical protein [Gossypium trilobum]